MTQRTRPVLYPILLAVFPVLSLYAQNGAELRIVADLLPALAVVAVAAVAVFGLTWAVLRNAHRAGLVTTLLILLFATAEGAPGWADGILSALSEYWVRSDVHTPPVLVLLVEGGVVAALSTLAIRKVGSPREWTRYLNGFAIILLILPIARLTTSPTAPAEGASTAFPDLASLPPTERRPDIYYIIMDGFARGDILRETFGYDLEPFLRRLEARGFVVSRNSTSNYCQTPLSLSSSLNGTHLPPSSPNLFPEPRPDPAWFRKNAVVRALRPLGYRFVSFASGFDFTEYPENDLYLSPFPYIRAFHQLLLEATPARRLIPSLLGEDSYTQTRERTNYLFDRLPEVAKLPGPKFTFAHILGPHPPFVFGADGSDASLHEKQYRLSDGDVYRYFYGGPSTYIPGYRNEVTYLVARVDAMIDQILANSAEPPIILLQSDHGSGLNLDMHSVQKTDHRERMSIMNAYFLPGGGRVGLTDAITPVNAFRVILNNEFGAHLDLLPDENYYSTWDHPFEFISVTDRVKTIPASSTATPPTPPPPFPGPATEAGTGGN